MLEKEAKNRGKNLMVGVNDAFIVFLYISNSKKNKPTRL